MFFKESVDYIYYMETCLPVALFAISVTQQSWDKIRFGKCVQWVKV